MYNYWGYLPTWASYPAHYFGYRTPVADHKARRRHKFAGNLFALLLLLVAPAAFLAIWAGLNMRRVLTSTGFGSLSLGGSFTQGEAKAIDFVSSALFSQVILEVFNYYWFGSARVAAPSAHASKDQETSLHSMIIASITSHGNYELPKLLSLLRSHSGRISILAWLSVTAALTKTAFSNLIAYEVNNDGRETMGFPIRLLADPIVQALPDVTNPSPNTTLLETTTGQGPYQFTLNQTSTLAQQVASMLTQLSMLNTTAPPFVTGATSFLQYNVTSSSLDNLSTNVTQLDNAPAYNSTISCTNNFVPTSLQITGDTSDNEDEFFVISLFDNKTNLANASSFVASIPGPMELFKNDILVPFLAFNDDETSFYMGYAFPLENTNQQYSPDTTFGKINPTNLNVSNPAWKYGSLSIWGLECEIQRRFGNVTLVATQQTFNDTWQISPSDQHFTGDFINSGRLVAKDLQTVLNYQSPITQVPGIGSAISASADPCIIAPDAPNSLCPERPFELLDYDALVTSLMFGVLQIERIAINIAGDNSVDVRFPNNTKVQELIMYDVNGQIISERYNIVYVPILLFLGLVTTIASSLIVIMLSLHSQKTIAAKEFRKVDSLRLLVDFVAGLRDEYSQDEWEELRHFSTEDLEEWAKDFKVAYRHVYAGRDAYGEPVGQSTVLVPRGLKRSKRSDKLDDIDDEMSQFL